MAATQREMGIRMRTRPARHVLSARQVHNMCCRNPDYGLAPRRRCMPLAMLASAMVWATAAPLATTEQIDGSLGMHGVASGIGRRYPRHLPPRHVVAKHIEQPRIGLQLSRSKMARNLLRKHPGLLVASF